MGSPGGVCLSFSERKAIGHQEKEVDEEYVLKVFSEAEEKKALKSIAEFESDADIDTAVSIDLESYNLKVAKEDQTSNIEPSFISAEKDVDTAVSIVIVLIFSFNMA